MKSSQQTRVAWRKFITAKQFIKETQNLVIRLRRLAVQGFTAKRCPLKHHKYIQLACVAWRLCIARQVVSGKFPKIRILQPKRESCIHIIISFM